MDIGKEIERITVEPLETPLPAEEPLPEPSPTPRVPEPDPLPPRQPAHEEDLRR